MARTWVQGAGQERGHDEIEKRVPAPGFHHGNIHCDLNNHVQKMGIGEFDLRDKHRTQCVEENLESCKENFTQDVQKDNAFKTSGQICVQELITHKFVVKLMIRLERRGIRNANRQIGEDGKQLIVKRLLEQEVVR